MNLLKLKAWQVFLIIIIPFIISEIIVIDSDIVMDMLDIFPVVVLFGWYMFLGVSLNGNLPEMKQQSDTLFMINGAYLIGFTSVSIILSNQQAHAEMPAWVLISLFYFVFAFVQVVIFLTRSYCALEESTNRPVSRIEIVFFSFFIYIIGLWVLQPRIRRLLKV